MASILSILRRIGGLKAAPATGSAGQLALWKAGAKPTDAASLYAHDGTQWVEVLDTSAKWTSDGSGNINRAAGNVGIGIAGTPPASKLDVNGTSACNTVTTTGVMDLALGQVFAADGSAGVTYSFTNVPVGRATTVILRIWNGGAKPQAFPATVHWLGGSAPTLTASKHSVLVFYTENGGTNWWGNLVGEAA